MCVLAGFYDSHSYSASYKPIPRVTIHETPASRLQRPRPPLRQPPGFRRHRRPTAAGPSPASKSAIATLRRSRSRICPVHIWPPARAPRPKPRCSRTSPRDNRCSTNFWRPISSCSARPCTILRSEPAQGLDRPHPGRGQDLQIQRPRCRRVGRQQTRHRRDLARRILRRRHSGCGGEHLETYLRWVFGFIGVNNPEFISADGIQVGPEHREKALAGALQAARNLDAA